MKRKMGKMLQLGLKVFINLRSQAYAGSIPSGIICNILSERGFRQIFCEYCSAQ